MSDTININLAIPTPITFKLGGDEWRINGNISMRDALELRRLDADLDAKNAAMLDVVLTAQRLSEDPANLTAAKMRKIESDVDDAILAFESAVGALEGRILALFAEQGHDTTSLRLGHTAARQIAGVAWQRAFGATDEALAAMGAEDESEENDPPTKRPSRARSTGQKSSSASAKPSAARRRNGSTSR